MALTPLWGWRVEMTKKAICPLGDTLAVEDGTEGDRITTPEKGFEKEGESARYACPRDGNVSRLKISIL